MKVKQVWYGCRFWLRLMLWRRCLIWIHLKTGAKPVQRKCNQMKHRALIGHVQVMWSLQGSPGEITLRNERSNSPLLQKFEMLPLLPMHLIKAICFYNVFSTVCIISSLRMGVYSTIRSTLRRDLSRDGIKSPVRTEIVSVLHITNLFDCGLMCM